MNYGRFFSVDTEASRPHHGITVFNYRGVKDHSNKIKRNDAEGNEEKISPVYPIYLVFSNDGVRFFMHYCKERKSDDTNEEPDAEKFHANSLILFLPASENIEVKDNLTNNLNQIFRNNFPVSDRGKNPIYKMVADGLENTERAGKGITYSSLEVFGIVYDKPENTSYPPIVGFLRKLFLDFLYDLEHTSVFQNTANYESIYIKLHENFLFSAVRNKAEYYYQRKYQQNIKVEGYPWDAAEKQLFFAEYYADAEQRWVDTITHPKADRYFHESDWFSDTEVEMDRIYLSGSVKFKLPAKRGEHVPDLESVRTKCCNEYISGIINKKDGSDKSLANTKSINKTKDKLKTSAKTAANWYIKKYSFSGTTKIWYGQNYKWIRILTTTLICFLCVALLAPSLNLLQKEWFTFTLGTIAGAILFWFVGLINPSKRYMRTIGVVNILMPRLFAAIVAAWFTLAIGEDIFKGFFDNVYKNLISIPIVVILIVFVYYEIKKINPYITKAKRIKRSLMLMTVAFTYAFMIGILVIHFFGGKYLERSDYIDEFYINNVLTTNPDFTIKEDRRDPVVHKIFYTTISKEDATLEKDIRRMSLTSNKGVMPNKQYDSIDYRLTLLLAKVFINGESNKDSLMCEKILEGSTVKSRVNKVREFIQENDTIPVEKLIASTSPSDTWKELLKSIDNQTIYRETLKELKPNPELKTSGGNNKHAILTESEFGIWIFRDMLLQFTFFAMFIGVFIQLIFEEKTITEPL